MLLIGCGSAAKQIALNIKGYKVLTVDERGASIILPRENLLREAEAYPYIPSSLEFYVKDDVMIFGYLGGEYGMEAIKLLGKITKKMRKKSVGYFIMPFPNEGYRYKKAVEFKEKLNEYYEAYTILDSKVILEKYRHLPFTKIPKMHAENILRILKVLNKNILEKISGRFYFGFGESSGIEARKYSLVQAFHSPWFEERDKLFVHFTGDLEQKEVEFLLRDFGKDVFISVERREGRSVEVVAISWD